MVVQGGGPTDGARVAAAGRDGDVEELPAKVLSLALAEAEDGLRVGRVVESGGVVGKSDPAPESETAHE